MREWLRGPHAWSGLGALVALPCVLAFGLGSTNFALDDAYIHLAYAKSLRLGDGLSYNPSDWELGASSPLWAVVLAPVAGSAHLVGLVQALGGVLHGVTAYLAGLASCSLRPSQPWRGGVCAALVAVHPVLLEGSVSGMEVSLTSALLAGVALASLRTRDYVAALISFVAVFARPEAAIFVSLLALGQALARKRWQPLAALVAACAALLLWAVQCELVAGYPLPNTFYAKAAFAPLNGLHYLARRVLVEEPWLVGIGGAWLLANHLRRATAAWRACSLAYLLTLFAIAIGRTLNLDVLFFYQRYFAVVAFVPVALAVAACDDGWRSSRWWLAPVAIVSLLMMPTSQRRTRAQEHSTQVLHVDVARWVDAHLPKDAVLAVEGAGALRYFTSREVRVVDLQGLNTHDVVHASSWEEAMCRVAAKAPGYLVVPDAFVESLAPVFMGEVVHQFHEPRFGQVIEPYPSTVHVVRLAGLHKGAREACHAMLPGRSFARP